MTARDSAGRLWTSPLFGDPGFITAAGAATADDNIRDQIDYEAQGVVRRNEGFVNRLLAFGGSGSGPAAAPLDPRTEEERLADDESIRRATGGGQVTIERDRGGFKLPGTCAPCPAGWASVSS